MVAQLTSRDFSPQRCPQLCAVLSNLSVTLESELNRYRRNRDRYTQKATNLFADIDDASFDLAVIESAAAASITAAGAIAKPTPPSLPPNRKLNSGQTPTEPVGAPQDRYLALLPTELATSSLALSKVRPHQVEESLLSQHTDKATHQLVDAEESDADADAASNGYLTSSEKLIESLAQVPAMPEPTSALAKPKHKTVSLLAGAALGLLGLVSGLGASYLMANPLVAQRIADYFWRDEAKSVALQTQAFDPPGPDLSANEFVDLELDNLSSLTMPQAVLNLEANVPASLTQAEDTSSTATNLSGASDESAIAPLSAAPPATTPAATLAPPIGTQAVVIPTGLTYYVTASFSSEQDLIAIRSAVSEAFVRRFPDGNRVQIAAFDNPQAAQTFITELSSKGIAAQIYGPTTE